MTWTNASIHSKRVTLNLARRSTAAKDIPGLVAAIDALDAAGWDMHKLAQGDVELIYTSFDEVMEQKVKDEFEADPSFLVDHGSNYTDCKLCGQFPIRFEFRIQPTKEGGQAVNCGIDCIVNHQLHVKGAETAEAARKVLECQIRKQLRKCRIEAWLQATEWNPENFNWVYTALIRAQTAEPSKDADWQVRNRHFRETRYLRHEARILERFFDRNGWLGTEKKWETWTRIVKFARQFGDCKVVAPATFAATMGKLPSEELKDAVVAPSAGGTGLEVPDNAPIKIAKQLELFESVTNQLVFGGN